MKRANYHTILGMLIILYCNLAFSQSNEETEYINKVSDSSYVSLSINYISDAVFMGRKDSIAAPYLYPTLLYHHKSGFYTSGSLSYLTRADDGRVDLFLLTGGFDFKVKKLDGDVSLTAYFFNEDSYNVISEVSTDLTALLEYDFDVISFGLSASTYFGNGNNSDLFLSSELSRNFITNDEKFQFIPTVGIYFGTQNFYEQYFINNRFGNGRGQGNSNSSQSSSINLNESEKFNLMAIEFSLPIWYEHKSFNAVIVPSFVIPQNEATLTVDDVLVKEDLDNSFYFIVGVYYRF